MANEQNKKEIIAVLVTGETPDGLSTLFWDVDGEIMMTDFTTRAEYTQRKTAGPLPVERSVKELYDNALIHANDLHAIGILNDTPELSGCLGRFLRSFGDLK